MLQPILTSSAVAFAAIYMLVLLVRRNWQGSTFALLLGLAACSALEISDLLTLLQPEFLLKWKSAGLLAEACLPLGWLLFGLTYARQWQWREVGAISKLLLLATLVFPLLAISFPIDSLFYSPDFAEEKLLFLHSKGYLFYVALMTMLVVALFHLERTFVALSRPDRWRAKFEIVGAGLLLTVLVIHYSQALLYRSLDMNLISIRSGGMVLAIVLMAYSRLSRGDVMRVRVSRNVVYRSVVILSVGLYLIALGVFSAGMRSLNVADNRTVVVALAVLLGLVLVVLLLSESVRRRIKVALHKNFYQNKYDYRNEWLQFTTKLAEAKNREELETGILTFFVETFSLRGAALFLRDQQSGMFHCCAQLEVEMTDLSLTDNLDQMFQMQNCSWVTDLNEEHPSLDGDWLRLNQRGCAFLVPLCFEQSLEGVIALGERIYGGERLTYEDFDLMKILAHQAIGVLLSRKLYTDLVAANEMAAIGRVSTFVIHDLKNLVSSLALVVDNAKDYIDDPEFRADMFETLGNTVENMNGLITRLQNVKRQPTLELASMDLLLLAQSAVDLSANPAVEVEGTSTAVRADHGELEKVLLNLLHNAREASVPEQPIRVEVGNSGLAFVRIVDSGVGMSEDFLRNRLFKPFETTKKRGMGIGLYQCRQIIEAHGGRIDVQSVPGKGSTFTLWLPVDV